MIPDRGRIGGNGGRPPFATLQHRRLVVFRDGLITALAVILVCCLFRGHEDKIVSKELETAYDETEVYA